MCVEGKFVFNLGIGSFDLLFSYEVIDMLIDVVFYNDVYGY